MKRYLTIAVMTILIASCANQGAPPRFSLGQLPDDDLEPGWWTTITTEETAAEVTVTVPSDVLFSFGESDLSPEALDRLQAVADDISARAAGPVTVVGHTDHVGSDLDNQRLGLARARSVISSLVELGVTPAELDEPASRGESEPVCPVASEDVDDPDCRAQNRRVVITYEAEAR